MKKLLALLMAFALVFSFAACGGNTEETTAKNEETTLSGEETTAATPENPVIRMSTTTSVNDSGLLPYLLPVFEGKTGYTVEVQSAGTGAAIQKAKDGNADLILVHSKASEEEFVNEGYGVERLPFMYNYFVIVGPEDDPAGIRDSENAAAAFEKISSQGAKFVSRGDDSGTHKAELKIWGEEVPDAATDTWYISAGQGMGACLTMANEQDAYCLTDKATFLSNKESLPGLDILLAEGEDMKNTYSVIECNPEKLDGVNTDGAKALIDWLLSDEADALIAKYGEEQYGQALFTVIEE
ncbi:MAG: tungsten ABC transporter substrate-binding protein [Ruminococcaceae bacterium]|nr:tungsten ABC transporter substrate-binding protein [Oscillospiraceae bacterium]MBR3595401.1 substrate-binding domain-containing protein [Clostridia bacterium]